MHLDIWLVLTNHENPYLVMINGQMLMMNLSTKQGRHIWREGSQGRNPQEGPPPVCNIIVMVDGANDDALDAYRSPRVEGDKFVTKFGDSLKFSPNLVKFLTTILVNHSHFHQNW